MAAEIFLSVKTIGAPFLRIIITQGASRVNETTSRIGVSYSTAINSCATQLIGLSNTALDQLPNPSFAVVEPMLSEYTSVDALVTEITVSAVKLSSTSAFDCPPALLIDDLLRVAGEELDRAGVSLTIVGQIAVT